MRRHGELDGHTPEVTGMSLPPRPDDDRPDVVFEPLPAEPGAARPTLDGPPPVPVDGEGAPLLIDLRPDEAEVVWGPLSPRPMPIPPLGDGGWITPAPDPTAGAGATPGPSIDIVPFEPRPTGPGAHPPLIPGDLTPGDDPPGYDTPGYDTPGYDTPGYDTPGGAAPDRGPWSPPSGTEPASAPSGDDREESPPEGWRFDPAELPPPPAIRQRLPLSLRVLLPVALTALAAGSAFLAVRDAGDARSSSARRLADIETSLRDSVLVEGTLTRVRMEVLSVLGGNGAAEGLDTDPAAVRRARNTLPVRNRELDSFQSRLDDLAIPDPLAERLTAAYVDDHTYVARSDALLERSVSDPTGAAAQVGPNVEELIARVETHRSIVADLDRAAAADREIATRPLGGLSRPLVLTSIVSGLAGLLLALWAVRSIRRPLRRVTETVDEVGAGTLGARTGVSGRGDIATLARSVDTTAAQLAGTLSQLEDNARRGTQNRVIFEAMEIADTEAEAHRVTEQALALFSRDLPAELLLAQAGAQRLWRIASNPAAGAAGCPVDSPGACFALRRGQTVIFDSSESINSCPKLRGRDDGPCSAVCIPVSFNGHAIGVLHATGPEHEPPDQGTVDQLVDLATQVGTRIGTLRTLESSRRQAATDGLTGLPNRRSIETGVGELLESRTPFVMVLADLDFFKSINDRFGHEVGDRSLQAFARTLQDNVRDGDLVSRYGGEEFVIVYPEMSVAGAMEAIERLRVAQTRHQEAAGIPEFTCSYGVAHSSVASTFDDIFRVADAGLLVAKEMGRNRVVFADQEMADRVFGSGPGAAGDTEDPGGGTVRVHRPG